MAQINGTITNNGQSINGVVTNSGQSLNGAVRVVGRGIASIDIDEEGYMTVTYTDGTTWVSDESLIGPAGPTGPTGPAGKGISNITIDQNGYMTVTYTDSTTWTSSTSLKGPKGDKGDTGSTGSAGPQGEKGDTGNGIASITKTGSQGLVDTYTITYTNGTTSTFTVTNGQNGSGSGTVTQVDTGVGLTGGPITGSGTIKANLKSETASTRASQSVSSTASRQYAVTPDSNGYLSVNVPWTDTKDYTQLTNKPTIPTVDQTMSDSSTNAISNSVVKGYIDDAIAGVSGGGIVVVSVESFSSLPQTISNAIITADMICLKAELGTPAAQTGNWTVTTANGSLTIAGTISGSTTATLYLARKEN